MSDESARTLTRETAGPGVVARRHRIGRIGQPWDAVAVVALGGVLGASARYGIGLAWPTPAGTLPWATLLINVVGCALMGVLMVIVGEVFVVHRLIRPFAGTGILGGFTTFSTYAVDVEQLVAHGAARVGLLYLVVTPAAALAAVAVAAMATREAVRRATR